MVLLHCCYTVVTLLLHCRHTGTPQRKIVPCTEAGTVLESNGYGVIVVTLWLHGHPTKKDTADYRSRYCYTVVTLLSNCCDNHYNSIIVTLSHHNCHSLTLSNIITVTL
jgi:hypothetical protein